MASDGLIRFAACAVLAVTGVTFLGAYGLLVGVPPFLAVFIALRGNYHLTTEGPPADWGELTPNLGWLVAGSVAAAALVNAGPLAAKLLADNTQSAIVSEFSYAVLVARVPLFMFQAVQAALLPRLSRLAASGNFIEFRSGLRRLLDPLHTSRAVDGRRATTRKVPDMSEAAAGELRFEPPGPGPWNNDPVHFPRPVTRPSRVPSST